jgi:hypothetical protein
MYASTLKRFVSLPFPTGSAQKRVKKQSRGKKKITFSRSGHGVEMDDVHIIRWDWKSG